ncbi:MAG: sugar kinase [Thermodesulfobacteriota bacterium]|nr:MAG: sugar kinase [Thermodesulfobacteriota bacterium]
MKKKMMKVAGVGQCSLDYIVSVKRFPEEDTKEEALGFTSEGGGPVATALVSLSRLGVKTYFTGLVSDDDAGKAIKKGLVAEGVDIKGLVVRKGGSSQRAFIVANMKNGSRTIYWQRPSVGELAPLDVNPSQIRGKDFLLVDGLMPGAALAAVRLARSLKIPIMLDAGSMKAGMLKLCGLCDYVIGSEDFSRAISPDPKKTLKKISALGPKAVTITMGRRGSVTWSEGRIFRTPAFRTRAVDTTGAGDVFHGGCIYGLMKGSSMEEAVRFASAFAALKCAAPGGRSGIPTLRKTLLFLKANR